MTLSITGTAPYLVYGISCRECNTSLTSTTEVDLLALAYSQGWARPAYHIDLCGECRWAKAREVVDDIGSARGLAASFYALLTSDSTYAVPDPAELPAWLADHMED